MDRLNSAMLAGIALCGIVGYALSHNEPRQPIPEITVIDTGQKVTRMGKHFEILTVNGIAVGKEVKE